MAISDKVIELSPVNKKKDIIFYIIMGVLLATSVLFLVLYLIKPNVVAGQISDVKLSSNLFVEEDGSLTAVRGAVGDDAYTICAQVGYSGEIDTSLSWTIPANQFTEVTFDQVTDEDKADAVRNAAPLQSEGESLQLYYKKIETAHSAQNASVQIAVRPNLTDKNGKSVLEDSGITVNVRDKGARGINILNVDSSSKNSVTMIGGNGDYTLNVPYVEGAKSQARYTVLFEQLPFADKFGRQTVITHAETNQANTSGLNYWTDSFIGGENGEGKVIAFQAVDPRTTDAFTFSVVGKGTSDITLTFNRYNSSEEFNVHIKVNVDSAANLDIVTKYSLMPTAVGNTQPDLAQAVSERDVFVGSTFDVPSYIAVTPFSRQVSWIGSVSRPNVRMTITSDAERLKPDTSVVERTGDSRGGTFALNPKKPGTAYVTLTDISEDSVGTSMTFKVNVVYRVRQFGYGENASNLSKTVDIQAINGRKGSIDVTYVLNNVFEDVKSEEVNAALAVSNLPKGIKIDGMENGVIKLSAKQKSRSANGVVVMTATVMYEIDRNMASNDVAVTFTALGVSSATDSTLTVNFLPRVEARQINFIDEERFAQIVSGLSDNLSGNVLAKKYARFEKVGSSAASLTLNMSGARTSLKLSDLVYFTDGVNNDFDHRVTNTGNLTMAISNVKVSGYTGIPFSWIYADAANTPFLAEIFPKINNESANGVQDQLNIVLSYTDDDGEAKTSELLLKISVVDNPEKIVYLGDNNKEFTYSSLVSDNSTERVIDVMPSTVRQMYASGLQREPSDYFVAISVNGDSNDNYLHASKPWNVSGYVYYFENASDCETFESRVENGDNAEDVRKFARNTALFAVKSNFDNAAKEVHLLKDLYFYDNSRITSVGFTLYPLFAGSESVDLSSEFKARTYFMTPVRLIDELRLDDVSGGQDGEYYANTSGGATYRASLNAVFYTGNAGDNSHVERQFAYSDIRGVKYIEEVEFSGECAGAEVEGHYSISSKYIEFGMPLLSGMDETASVTLTFAASSSLVNAVLRLNVQNKTLGIDAITLYKDENHTDAYTDGERILLSGAENTTDANPGRAVVYFKVDYPSGENLSEYLQYDKVLFSTDDASAVTYSVSYSAGNPAAAGAGYTHYGTLTLTAVKGMSGASKVKLISQTASGGNNIESDELSVSVFVPSSGVSLIDKDGVENTAVHYTVNDATSVPTFVWTLQKNYDVDLSGATKGNTYFTVTADGDYERFNYNKESGAITLMLRRENTANKQIKFSISEYTTVDDKKVGNYELTVSLDVTVAVYKLDLEVNGGTATGDGGISVNTLGSNDNAKVAAALGVKFNGGDAQPIGATVEYILLKNNRRVTVSSLSVFALKETGGVTSLVYDDKAVSIGNDVYMLYAVSGGVETARVRLYLTTSVQYLQIESVTQDGKSLGFSGGEIHVFDTSKPIVFSAGVYNSGDSSKNNAAAVSYAVSGFSGGAAASIDASGELRITSASGSFTVTVSHGDLRESVSVTVNNTVTAITTNFDGQQYDSAKDEVVIRKIYNGTTASDFEFGYSDGSVTLIGEGGKTPYTNEFTVSTSGSVFALTFDASTKTYKVALRSAGEQTMQIRVETYPRSGRYVVKTVRLIVAQPVLSATVSGGKSVRVNLMDENVESEFDIAVSGGAGEYAVSGVTVDFGGNGDKFEYSGGKLKLKLAAFESENLTSSKTYSFSVSANIGGLQAANTVTLSVTVSADATFSEPLFEVRDGTAPVRNGSALELSKSGDYSVVSVSSHALTYSVTGAKIEGGVLKFDTVGNVMIRASFVKYGKTFEAGETAFTVKNNAESLSATLTSGHSISDPSATYPEIADSSIVAADYTTAKKYVYYTVSWADTGEELTKAGGADNFGVDNFKLRLGGVLSEAKGDGYAFLSAADKTVTYRLSVDDAGTASVWAVFTVGSRTYTTSVTSVTFTMDYRPESISVNDVDLAPALSGLNGKFAAPVVKDVNGENYKLDNYTVKYELVGNSDVLTVAADGTYSATLTESGEIARVKVTLTLTNGRYKDKTYETFFTVTVAGEKKSTIVATPTRYLKPGETVNVSDLVKVVYGDNAAAPALTDNIIDNSPFLSVDKNSGIITAKSTASGVNDAVIRITATFTSDKWGTYSVEAECNLTVLPDVTVQNKKDSSENFDMTAYESVSFKAVADNKPLAATYEITQGADLGEIVGDTFYSSGKGGVVKVRVRASIDNAKFGVIELDAKEITFTVRAVELKNAVSLAAGGTKIFAASDFAANVSGVNLTLSAMSSDSDIIDISGNTVTVKSGVNAYLKGQTVPNALTATVRVIARDANYREYRGEFTLTVRPTEVEITVPEVKVYNLIVGQSAQFEYTLVSGGTAIDNFYMTDAEGGVLWGTTVGNKMRAEYVADSRTDGEKVLTAHVVIDGNEYALAGVTLTVAEKPSVSASGNAADKIAAGLAQTYTFAVVNAEDRITEIELVGLSGATANITGAQKDGNKFTLSGGATSVTVTVTATGGGTVSFTPKIGVDTRIPSSSNFISDVLELSEISFEAVDVPDALTVGAIVNGAVREVAGGVNVSIGDSISFTVECGTLPQADISVSYADYGTLNNVGGVFTASTAGDYTVTVRATVYGKSLSATVDLTFAAAEAEPTFAASKNTENPARPIATLAENFEIEHAIVTSGNADIVIASGGKSFTLTFTAGGNVTVLVVGRYVDQLSAHNGKLYTCQLTFDNDEPFASESDLSVAYEHTEGEQNAKLTLTASEGITASITAAKVGETSLTLNDDKEFAFADLGLGETDKTITVEVTVTSVHYGSRKFYIEVVVDGIPAVVTPDVAYSETDGEKSLRIDSKYDGMEISVTSDESAISVTADENDALKFNVSNSSENAVEAVFTVIIRDSDGKIAYSGTVVATVASDETSGN